jgi:hypothetical protein
MNIRPHKTLERNGQIALQLTEGQFSGIIFSYGRVSFNENKETDNLTVEFDYFLHDDAGHTIDDAELKEYLGDFLMELVVFGIEQNNITYTGGIDENREVDIIESDSQ